MTEEAPPSSEVSELPELAAFALDDALAGSGAVLDAVLATAEFATATPVDASAAALAVPDATADVVEPAPLEDATAALKGAVTVADADPAVPGEVGPEHPPEAAPPSSATTPNLKKFIQSRMHVRAKTIDPAAKIPGSL